MEKWKVIISTYVIDADVNSLYQAAMKNEFPIGIPIHLHPNAPSVKYLTK